MPAGSQNARRITDILVLNLQKNAHTYHIYYVAEKIPDKLRYLDYW